MILKIEPIFVKKPWGGNDIKKVFNKKENNANHGKIGEVVLFSGDGDNINRIIGTNKYLDEFYKENREKLFNNYYKDKFPFSIKIINTGKNLPVVVNPKISFFSMKKKTNETNQIWYPLDLDEKEKFVIGIKNKSLLKNALKFYDWKFVFEEESLEKNKAYNVNSGTIYNIKANSLIFSVEDNTGKPIIIFNEKEKDKEKLLNIDNTQIKKILKSINEKNLIKSSEAIENITNESIKIIELAKNNNFTLEKWEIFKKVKIKLPKNKVNFLTINCLEGHGIIGNSALLKNENIIITSDELDRLIIDGKMTLLVAYPNNLK
ncbi:MAG: hypothetical protein HPAVJP_1590 [Candidatus Hepatoplasma vulgare]|nr:MAG: hypothetical protein HPAVJP_1590 [Candidatus Hepatoplasma sp.]